MKTDDGRSTWDPPSKDKHSSLVQLGAAKTCKRTENKKKAACKNVENVKKKKKEKKSTMLLYLQ